MNEIREPKKDIRKRENKLGTRNSVDVRESNSEPSSLFC